MSQFGGALSPTLADFTASYADGGGVVWATRVGDLETPVSALLKLGAEAPGVFLLESVQGGDFRGRYSIIGLDPDLIWRVKEGRAEISQGSFEDAAFAAQPNDPLDSLRTVLRDSALQLPDGLPPMAAGLFGYLGYDMVRLIERLPDKVADPLCTPDAVLVRPTLICVFDNVTSEITVVTPARFDSAQTAAQAYEGASERLARVWRALASSLPTQREGASPPPSEKLEPRSNTTPNAYRALVAKCKEYCRAGDVFQVVPSQRFSAPFDYSSFALYRALRRLNPSPFLYYLNFADFSVVGSSPEILVRLRGETVTIRPIAGTRPRGATPAEDSALEQELLADPKERAEHLMLVDLARNDLGRVAKRGGSGNRAAAAGAGSAHVRVTEAFTIERYSHVMHIVSNVEGEIAAGLSALDALLAGFPHGTVTGAPKIRAMEVINEVEPHKRGIYAGGVGYFGAGGDMDTCIALRTGVLKGGTLHVQAGGGVVLDSDAEAELQETLHKSRALFRAAAEAWRYS